MPMLSKFAAQYRDKDVSFLAVSLDDAQSQPKIPRFLEKKKITLPIFTGATPATLHDFQLGEIVPATIILDRDGSAIFRIMGEASKKDISTRVDWLLSARTSKSPKPLLKNF
jgi:thiol-disulfide isomerase/thioredoxin